MRRLGVRGESVWRSDADRAIHDLRLATTWTLSYGEWRPPPATTEAERLGLIERAVRRRGPLAVPALVPLILDPDEEVGQKAAHAVVSLVEGLRPLQRAWLDRRMRIRGGELWVRWFPDGAPYKRQRHSLWNRSERSAGARVRTMWWRPSAPHAKLADGLLTARIGALQSAAWCLLSMSIDGYQRQRAVDELANSAGVASLAHLMLRAFDWVDPVRRLAVAAVMSRVDLATPEELVEVLPLAHHLLGRGRRWHEKEFSIPNSQALLEWMLVKLDQPEFRGPLVAALKHADSATRRAAFRQLRRHGLEEGELLSVLRGPDIVLAREALRQVDSLPSDRHRRLYEEAARSGLADVRRDAVGRLVADDSKASEELVFTSLFDTSERVRDLARWLLRDRRDEVLTRYRDALTDACDVGTLRAALYGLAAMDRDWIVAESYLHAQDPGIRGVAVRSVGRADREAALQLLPDLVADPDPAVSRAATNVLRAAGTLSFAVVERLLRSDMPHVVSNAARLASWTGGWSYLRLALRLTHAADEKQVGLGLTLLRAWPGGQALPSIRPSRVEIDEISTALERLGWAPSVVTDAFRLHGVPLGGWSAHDAPPP